jgi:hypothetical protein
MIQDVHRGSRIRILIFYPSRILDQKKHRISDPDPWHWHLGLHFNRFIKKVGFCTGSWLQLITGIQILYLLFTKLSAICSSKSSNMMRNSETALFLWTLLDIDRVAEDVWRETFWWMCTEAASSQSILSGTIRAVKKIVLHLIRRYWIPET